MHGMPGLNIFIRRKIGTDLFHDVTDLALRCQ